MRTKQELSVIDFGVNANNVRPARSDEELDDLVAAACRTMKETMTDGPA